MSETLTENAEVASYLAAIRNALTDLEPADRDDLLEDLEAHLYEVLAESVGASLESSLGAPAAYADELRASAGLDRVPSALPPVIARLQRRLAASRIRATLRDIAEQPWASALREFLPTLRPGWWVLRGWLAIFAGVVWLHGNVLPYRQEVLFATYHGNTSAGLITLAVATAASLWLGALSRRMAPWLRWLVVAGNVVILFVFWSSASNLRDVVRGYDFSAFSPNPAPVATVAPTKGLFLDGQKVENVYPYDAQGHLLTQVRLYDQQGRPLQGLTGTAADGRKLVRVLPSDAAGAAVANEYPQKVAAAPLDSLRPFVRDTGGLPTTGPSAEAAYGRATPMPTPTVFVPPMAGATSSAVPTTTPTPSVKPTGTKTTAAASKATTRVAVPTRSGVSGSTSRTP